MKVNVNCINVIAYDCGHDYMNSVGQKSDAGNKDIVNGAHMLNNSFY